MGFKWGMNDSSPHLSPNLQIKMPKRKLRCEMGLLNTLQAALAAGADENKAAQPAEVEGGNSWEECAVILWSSGTTGRPKGILHR